jgi:hypothetical protein
LQLYLAIQFLASLLRSEGASENSPQFQLRVNATKKPSPAVESQRDSNHSAQGWRAATTLGQSSKKFSTPTGLYRRLSLTDSTLSGLLPFYFTTRRSPISSANAGLND